MDKWIPVDVALPRVNGKYLVTTRNLTGYKPLKDNVFIANYYYGEWDFEGWEDNDVIAWMTKPMPMPYETRISKENSMNREKLYKRVNKVIDKLDKLGERYPDLEIGIEAPSNGTRCKLSEANIYLGMGDVIMIDAE